MDEQAGKSLEDILKEYEELRGTELESLRERHEADFKVQTARIKIAFLLKGVPNIGSNFIAGSHSW
jgi:hypothetical protein